LGICKAEARAAEYTFAEPSDDRWHYPFNFSGGSRPAASCFGSFGTPDFTGFNDRDAVLIVGWDTTSQIEPDLDPASYDICSVTVTLTNAAGAAWFVDPTVDEWFTFDLNRDGFINRDGAPRGAPGDHDGESSDPEPGRRPVELFGAGFGPVFSYETWHEGSPYEGAVCEPVVLGGECQNDPRDPFPFVFDDLTGAMLHVEDSIKGAQNESLDPPLCDDPDGRCPFTAIPWAIGAPINYAPGFQDVPFDVRFDVDLALSDGAVREYFQEQLGGGRVFVIVSSLTLVEEQSVEPTYPNFLTKESTEGPAPRLTIHLAPDPPGDLDGDGAVSLAEYGGAIDCLAGPGRAPTPTTRSVRSCLCDFDTDGDDDVDLRDLGRIERFAVPGD
jgi:hypothetical protein